MSPRGTSGGRVVAALLGVQLAFATLSIVGKVTLHVVPPLALVTLRLLGGAAFFSALAVREGRPLIAPRGERLAIARLAALGLVINQVLFTMGLSRTTAIDATVLIATIPLVTATYAVASGREPSRARVWVGVLVALAGVVVIVRPERLGLTDRTLVGDALVLLNSVSYGAYLVHAREAIARHGTARVLTWIFVTAAAMVAPFGLPVVFAHAPGWTARHWLAIAYVVLVPTVFAYGANAWALARAPSSLVAVFIYLQPALAVLLAVFFGDPLARWLAVPLPHETFTASAAAGMLAIFAGVYLAARR